MSHFGTNGLREPIVRAPCAACRALSTIQGGIHQDGVAVSQQRTPRPWCATHSSQRPKIVPGRPKNRGCIFYRRDQEDRASEVGLRALTPHSSRPPRDATGDPRRGHARVVRVAATVIPAPLPPLAPRIQSTILVTCRLSPDERSLPGSIPGCSRQHDKTRYNSGIPSRIPHRCC